MVQKNIRTLFLYFLLMLLALACVFPPFASSPAPVVSDYSPEMLGTVIAQTAAAALTQTAPVPVSFTAEANEISTLVPSATPTLFSSSTAVNSSALSFIPNIETIGIIVGGNHVADRAELMYRQSNDTVWRSGHPLIRMDDGRLAGSLFGLSASTSYDVKVFDGITEVTGSVTTQPDEIAFTPAVILHVDDDAPLNGDGSISAPFKSIQEGLNHAVPGTQVLVADGVYHEAISFPSSGREKEWIQVKAEGNAAVLDGSQALTGDVWKLSNPKRHLWFTKINSSIKYLARDGQRFYMYDDLKEMQNGRGHDNTPVSEGWYIDPNNTKLYVRSSDDPSKHTWQVPIFNNAVEVTGRNWIWVEGFEIRFYGTGYGCGICVTNASHVVIRKNKIHNLQVGVFINWTGGSEQGNDTRIEYNEVSDPPVNEWLWNAVKGTSMEGTAIVIRGHVGAIVRGNELHHINNGVYTGSSARDAMENPDVALDVDVYNNKIHHIGDDGLEPEGACVNHRFRNNVIDTTLVGVSLAPITQGPVWVLRSLITNYTGTSFKWARKSHGAVFIYHNTSWTNEESLNAMTLISPVFNSVMRNNIFQGNGYAFEEPFTGSSKHDWNNDNWFTTRGSSSSHFKWEDKRYKTITDLCAATRLECNGYETPPEFFNPLAGDFTLLPSSPNIDRGILIPGINDSFNGSAPDAGAYEAR